MISLEPATRRERVRAATVDEIKSTALQLLVEHGPAAMTLRAIAREMGMTAPGLYRYFPSLDDLQRALVTDAYDRLTGVLAAARDAIPAEDVGARLVATAVAFRAWAVAHPREFGLVFSMPVPKAVDADDPVHQAGMRFGAVFTGIFFELWLRQPFPVADDASLPADLVRQLQDYRSALVDVIGDVALRLPVGALAVFLRMWVELYGLVAMEVYNHLHFCLDDAGPLFEASLHAMGEMIGLKKDIPTLAAMVTAVTPPG